MKMFIHGQFVKSYHIASYNKRMRTIPPLEKGVIYYLHKLYLEFFFWTRWKVESEINIYLSLTFRWNLRASQKSRSVFRIELHEPNVIL